MYPRCAGGWRQVRARHPNANPEYDTWPYGYLTANWWDPPPPAQPQQQPPPVQQQPQQPLVQQQPQQQPQPAGGAAAAAGDGVVVNYGAGGDSAAAAMRSFNEFPTGGTIMGGANAGRYSPPSLLRTIETADMLIPVLTGRRLDAATRRRCASTRTTPGTGTRTGCAGR